MSEAFERYERLYCEVCENLWKKCASANALDGEQRKQKLCQVKAGMDNAETLIKEMDAEARSLQPNVKAVLLAKLREYKSDLDNLKTEVTKQTSNSNQVDTLPALAETHDQTSHEIRETILDTEELDVPILQDLESQPQQPFLHAHAHKTLHDVDDNKERRISRWMSRNKKRIISAAIVAALIVAILLILYFILPN
nr:vesicle transport V-SNARE 13-like [Ipomoea batatas]